MDERTQALTEACAAVRGILFHMRDVPGIDMGAALQQVGKWERTASDYAAMEDDSYWENMWPGKPIVNLMSDKSSETTETFCNKKCQVLVYDWPSEKSGMVAPEGWPKIVNLSMKLNTREPWHDWREFQRVKNELCGTACWAFELYPPQDALVDTANQYHMWIFPPGYDFPIQLEQTPIVDYSPKWQQVLDAAAKSMGEEVAKGLIENAKQRKWEDHHKCDDLPLIGPVWRKRGYRIDSDGYIVGPEGRVAPSVRGTMEVDNG